MVNSSRFLSYRNDGVMAKITVYATLLRNDVVEHLVMEIHLLLSTIHNHNATGRRSLEVPVYLSKKTSVDLKWSHVISSPKDVDVCSPLTM